MKNKICSLVLIFYLLLTLAVPLTYAEAPISGTAYGQNIGLIHFDYSTSVKPVLDADNDGTPDYLDANNGEVSGIDPVKYDKYYLGAKNEFYISPGDEYYTGAPETWKVTKVNDFGDPADKKCTSGACLLHGFAWNDTIGWIILDGPVLQTSIGPGFTADMFPRIEYQGLNGILKGYAWSENAGWIKLSSDTMGVNDKIASDSQNQGANADKWGVWINTDPITPVFEIPREGTECATYDQETCLKVPACKWDESADPQACAPVPLQMGRALHGNAWSEKLGWIKFDKTAGETDFDFGAYTMWVPDSTPPEINAAKNTWFANKNSAGAIFWPNFAEDPQSGIDPEKTELTIVSAGDNTMSDGTTDNPDYSPSFVGCESVDSDDISNDVSGDGLSLALLQVGHVKNAPVGFCKYVLSGNIVNGAGLSTPVDLSFYVRAGDYDETNSSADNITATAVADGMDSVDYKFTSADIAGNPIVPVKVSPDGDSWEYDEDGKLILETGDGDGANWVRDVQVKYTFDSANIYFNTASSSPSNPKGYLPVKIDDGGVSESGAIYNPGNEITFPLNDPENPVIIRPDSALGFAYLQVASYAPTKACGADCNENEFLLKKIDLTVIDRAPELINPPNEYVVTSDTPLPTNALANSASMYFTPAITLSNGNISPETFGPGIPVTASFTANNVSAKSAIGDISIDNILTLNNTGEGYGEQLFDLRNVGITDDYDTQTRTDPINLSPITITGEGAVNVKARYELFRGTPANIGGSSEDNNGSDTVYHTEWAEKYPDLWDYSRDIGPAPSFDPISITDPVDINGAYNITGIFDKPDAENPPDILIDRSDSLADLNLDVLNNDNETDSADINIGFTVYDIYGEQPTASISAGIYQYVAYRMPLINRPAPAFDDFAVYMPTQTVPDAEVKRVGVQATGMVTGENVYETMGGREFEAISSPGLAQLKTQMRDNAAELSRNLIACGIGTISEFAVNNTGCIRYDLNNKTVVAVYEGTPEDTLVIDASDDTITIPDGYLYTIIVKGGANVFIKDNIAYEGDNASFGMIVLADEKGNGGNVYISPDPTNIVGLLYAEGSLLSSPNGSTLYYATADAGELKNQLYWKGSIVSKNTIGGAANRVAPDGVCGDIDLAVCSQIYDLDFIRRFTVKTDENNKTYSAAGALFSGGGSCGGAPDTCNSGLGDSVITVTNNGNNGNIDLTPGKSVIDPFFIEKDSRPAPPGFTTAGGIERTIEVR
jgi:hypothetical protein